PSWQDAEKVRQPVWFVWSIRSVWFIWLVLLNKPHEIDQTDQRYLENTENENPREDDTLSPYGLGGRRYVPCALVCCCPSSLWPSHALVGSQDPPLSARERPDRNTLPRRVGHDETTDRVMVGKAPPAVSRPLHQIGQQRIRNRTGCAVGGESPDCRDVSAYDAAGGRCIQAGVWL